jgi:hypothetical protein
MSEPQPWVYTDCKACGFKGSARSIKALVEAMAEHDRYCARVDLHSDPAPVEMSPMK